ncbi:hypothetical protein Q0Z83_060400 [Actinoplanes sichuanensis]|uniref:Uncharacterized protein n=1 Tax=Actinoplanes sichuanensis TaxID=512349 RepID=A0ABW4A7N7_9ACTN|nr:hypothetical protein [Actinoplanes sichuanensis]BEL07849.1 hypothetical protein Q0Z83_060400 [Actinoplanes sichuanensis]
MQPQYPGQPAMPQYPQQPQQGYPAQPAYPQQPQFPVQPAYPPHGYGQPQYAPQQYQQPVPAQPLPSVGLDDYWQQPSSAGGPSLKFKDAQGNPQIGKAYEGFIARTITDGDIRPQTDRNGQVQTYRDGRPKAVMVVPLIMQPSQEFPDGQAGWWVKGQSRDELARAMAEAGAPAGAPESGAWVRITLVSVRPIPNMSPAFQYRVEYRRPAPTVDGPAPGLPIPTPPVPAPAPVYAPQQQAAPVMSTASGQPIVHQQPVPPAPPAQQQQQPPAPQPVPAQAPAPAAAPAAGPAGFSPEQQALFAHLTGQSAG